MKRVLAGYVQDYILYLFGSRCVPPITNPEMINYEQAYGHLNAMFYQNVYPPPRAPSNHPAFGCCITTGCPFDAAI